jgi:transposase InsO family protein
VRPVVQLICEFITEHRQGFGVAPICRALTFLGVPIAPRTYFAQVARLPSKRALWDVSITEVLASYYTPDERGRRAPESLYGSLKMWAHLQRLGVPVAAAPSSGSCVTRAGTARPGPARSAPRSPTPAAERAPDLVKRHYKAECPDQLWVADFTYVPMISGFGYTAFVIDAFVGRIVGWECSLSKETVFVESAIRQVAAFRARAGHPLAGGTIHHSDAGSQYTAVRFGETLMLAGLTPSIGTVGDALDNALAETTIGLYKTECVRGDSLFRNGPLTTLADLEEITSAWVHWYNNDRLMHRLGRVPPAETEADYYATTDPANPPVHTN